MPGSAGHRWLGGDPSVLYPLMPWPLAFSALRDVSSATTTALSRSARLLASLRTPGYAGHRWPGGDPQRPLPAVAVPLVVSALRVA